MVTSDHLSSSYTTGWASQFAHDLYSDSDSKLDSETSESDFSLSNDGEQSDKSYIAPSSGKKCKPVKQIVTFLDLQSLSLAELPEQIDTLTL
jgi:hypothetical protein